MILQSFVSLFSLVAINQNAPSNLRRASGRRLWSPMSAWGEGGGGGEGPYGTEAGFPVCMRVRMCEYV
jgi:hypothetical protein